MHSSPTLENSAILEKLVLQRNQARAERDRYLELIRRLIELDGAPRSIHYSRAWESALEDAREAIRDSPMAGRSASSAV